MSSIVSIIMPIKDGIEFLPTVLNNIVDYSDVPFELILVNDCSDKETTDYLENFGKDKSFVKIVTNKSNIGYVKSVNKGIENATGNILVIINSDVIVGRNWLSELCKYFASDDIVLVSPLTNYVFGNQKVDIDFKNMEDFLSKADKFRLENRGKLKFVSRLAGFCLVTRKSLIDEIGVFDERFSPGNFEDDDFCLRTVIAGYKPAMTLDVLVWHLGTRTFGKDRNMYNRLLLENKEKFSNKWSTRILNDKSVFKHLPTLSVAMIVKDEEDNLKELIPEIRPVVDEIIVVDTGSKDKTVKIAKSLKVDKVLNYKWDDDFASARNVGIEKCTKDYIMWLDADDRITFADIFNLKIHLKFYPNTAVFLNLLDRRFDGDYHSIQIRVFPNFRGIKFRGRIHEQISYDIEEKKIPYSKADIFITHTGYSSEKKIRKKFLRNLNILKKEDSNDFMTNIHLSRTYLGLGDYNNADYHINKAIEISKNNDISSELKLLLYFTKISIYYMHNKDMLLQLVNEIDLDHELMYAFKAIILFSFQKFGEAYNMLQKINKKLDLSIVPIDVGRLLSSLQQVRLFSSLYAGDLSMAESVAQEILGTTNFKIGGFNES